MFSLLGRDEAVDDLPQARAIAMAHGITMALAFLVLFPAGAIFIRVLNVKQTMWIHASCQMIGWCLMLAGFATGMRLREMLGEEKMNHFHVIIGMAIVAGMLLMPWFGYIHHRRYLILRRKTTWTHTHVWFGRVLIILGIANGGIGFSLASEDGVGYSQVGMIVYAAIAGVAGISLIGLAISVSFRGKGVEEEQLSLNHRS